MNYEMTTFTEKSSQLRQLPMTVLEEQLKQCYLKRTDLHNKVLTADEMSDYVNWMIETQDSRHAARIFPQDIPSMLTGGTISRIGHQFLQNPNDKNARRELSYIYESPAETSFFSENQDISAGRSLRYLPAYWRADDYFELYYVFSGQCPVMFEHETVILKPGTILIVPPAARKAYTCPADDCVMFFYMIRLSTFSRVFWAHLSDQNLMSLFFRQALNREGNTSYIQFDTNQDIRIEAILYEIYCQYLSNEAYSSQLLNPLMSTFFLFLLQRYEHTARISKSCAFFWKPEFSVMFNYIQNHYASVTLKELSEKFNYSERQIMRIIQNCTGKNFSQLLIQLRMTKAAHMLTAHTASIHAISTEVGYSTLSSFYRTFTQYYKCTPKEYICSQRIEV